MGLCVSRNALLANEKHQFMFYEPDVALTGWAQSTLRFDSTLCPQHIIDRDNIAEAS